MPAINIKHVYDLAIQWIPHSYDTTVHKILRACAYVLLVYLTASRPISITALRPTDIAITHDKITIFRKYTKTAKESLS